MDDNLEKAGVFGFGNPNYAYAQCFVEKSYLNQITKWCKTVQDEVCDNLSEEQPYAA